MKLNKMQMDRVNEALYLLRSKSLTIFSVASVMCHSYFISDRFNSGEYDKLRSAVSVYLSQRPDIERITPHGPAHWAPEHWAPQGENFQFK